MMRLRLALAATIALAAAPAAAQSRTVSLTAPDGVYVTAALYEPHSTPSPAVLLLHMLGRSHADWNETAERLRGAGFLVLAPDFRWIPPGGASGARDLKPLVGDAGAALAYLKQRTDVLTGRIGVAGASVGASVAALAAADDPEVRALALLSPSLDYRGLRCEPALRRFGARHVFMLSAASDPYAVRSIRQLASGGPNREVLITDTPGHGTMLLARQPDLVERLVDWFRATLL